MAIEFDSHPFWDYSLDVYRRAGVSEALINFQDRHNLDVNIMLLCLWSGRSGRGVLTDSDFDHALRVSDSWNPDIVCGIRAVRIRLRQEIELVPTALREAVRKKLLNLEIECEHVEQLSLAAGLSENKREPGPSAQQVRDCGHSLRSYFDRKECALDRADRDGLVVILSAAFPEVEAARIEGLCEEIFF